MKLKRSARLIGLIFIFAFAVNSSVLAETRGKTGKTSKEAVNNETGWILPSPKSRMPITIQAGKTLPLKFKLNDSGVPLMSTEMVQVFVNPLTSCEASASNKGSQIVLVAAKPSTSPSPAVTTSPSPTNSADDSKEFVLKLNEEVFTLNWKIPKNLASGCFQVVAQKDNLISRSPLFKVRSKK